MSRNQQLQKEEIESREALLKLIDENQKINQLELDNKKQRQIDQQKQWDVQINEKVMQTKQQEAQLLKDEELIKQTEAEYIKMLRQEAEKIDLNPDNPQKLSKLNQLMNNHHINHRRLW